MSAVIMSYRIVSRFTILNVEDCFIYFVFKVPVGNEVSFCHYIRFRIPFPSNSLILSFIHLDIFLLQRSVLHTQVGY